MKHLIVSERVCGEDRPIQDVSFSKLIMVTDEFVGLVGIDGQRDLMYLLDVMLENIYRTRGVIFAQRVMNALIGKGLSREQAYDTVQPIAMRAMSERRDYQELLRESPEVMQHLTPEELDGCFTLDYYMKNVDYIYNRAGVK